MNIMEIKGVRYSYDNKRNILKGVSASLEPEKMYAILGPSGCGKTTLLSLLGGLNSPADGRLLFAGQNIKEKGLAAHRKNNLAFIFQSYNLIDYLTLKENVALTSKLPPLPIDLAKQADVVFRLKLGEVQILEHTVQTGAKRGKGV